MLRPDRSGLAAMRCNGRIRRGGCSGDPRTPRARGGSRSSPAAPSRWPSIPRPEVGGWNALQTVAAVSASSVVAPFGCARLGLVVGVPVSGCRTRARCASRSSRSSSAGVTNGARWRAAVWARRRRSRFRIAAIVCVLVGNWSARKLVGQPCSASSCRLVAALSASTRPGSSRSRRRAVFSGMPRMAPAVVRWIRAGRASAERNRRRTRVTATPDVSAMSAADPTAHVVGPPEHAAGHEWLRSTAKGRHLPRRPALALRQPVVLRFVGREAPAGLGRGPHGAVPAQGVRGRRQPLRPGPGPPSSGSSGPSSQPERPAGSDRSHGRPARTSFPMMPFGTWRRSRPGRPVRGGADSGSITSQA